MFSIVFLCSPPETKSMELEISSKWIWKTIGPFFTTLNCDYLEKQPMVAN